MARNFSQIFSEVVPGGSACLRLIKLAGPVNEESQKTFATQFPTQRVNLGDNQYSGIKVLVSFSTQKRAHVDENDLIVVSQEADGEEQKDQEIDAELSLSQLSGGQKAVVAACLIFAIQKIDAAPFYIMDEFDAALDAQYCQGIADQIKKLSAAHKDTQTAQMWPGSQFLMTTFKPHVVKMADKVFEAAFIGQKSNLRALQSEEEALQIIRESK